MRRPQGYAVWQDKERHHKRTEVDTVKCGHCQRISFVKARKDPADLGGFCRVCMRMICGPCADKFTCTPFEKALEAEERKDRFHQQIGTLLK